MSTNLLSLAQQALGGDFSKLAGQFLGESTESTQSALTSLLPAVVGGIANKGATSSGATSLLSLINGSNLDTGVLGNLASLFGGGGSAANSLMKLGASSLVPALFGDKSGALVNALASATGLRSASSTNLIAIVVPLVLTLLKKLIGERGLNAGSLATMLSGQGPNLQNSLDKRLTGALGFGSPAAFLSGLSGVGGQAVDAAQRAGTAAAATTAAAAATAKSGLMRWLPWILGALALLILWNLFSGKSAAPSAPAVPAAKAPAAPTAAAPAPVAPAPVAPAAMAGLPAKVYFEVGSSALGADAGKAVAAAAEIAKKDGTKLAVTGFTDRTGDAAKNEELAKARAVAVRDALKNAGVAEASIEMRPPMFVETGAAGSDAEARRVEISRP